MIKKIVRKTLLKNKGLLLAVFLLYVMSTFLISASFNTFKEMEANYETFLETNNVEHFRLGLVPGYQKIDDEMMSYRDELDQKLDEDFAREKENALKQFDIEFDNKVSESQE